MRILTIVKHVPDSNVPIKVRPDGTGIDTTGLKYVIDPFDEFGVELAVQLREKRGDVSEIIALTQGPEKAAETLRVALAMGADSAIHLSDPIFESFDELFYASVIAEAVTKQSTPFDLVLCGKHNIDLDAGAVGPALAEFLDLAHVGAVTNLEITPDGRRFTARRRIEGAEEVVEGALPALLTIEKGLVEPRYPSLPNLMKAKKKPLTVLTSKELPGSASHKASAQIAYVTPPPPRPECKFIEGEPAQMAHELVRFLRDEAKVL